jgi:hypothetical protein
MAAFSRLVAIFIGLANLVVLVGLTEGYAAVLGGNVAWIEALPFVLVAVGAGLAAAEIVLRWFRASAHGEEFSNRYGIMVFAVSLGGLLMGVLLPVTFAFDLVLNGGEPLPRLEQRPEALLFALLAGFFGALYGVALGFIEGLFLAFPLAAPSSGD